MIRTVALVAFLLLAPLPFLASADTQVTDVEGLPNPTDYVAAGSQCKSKVKVTPWLSTPAVDFPKTSKCVLEVVTCRGVIKFNSNPRPNAKGMCLDYQKVHDILENREACCDRKAP